MISERTLKRWRRDALNVVPVGSEIAIKVSHDITSSMSYIREVNQRILRLTQELMDLHLIRKG